MSLRRREQEKPTDEEDVEIPIGVEVLCCAFSGDGEFFAVGASDGVVRVYNDSTRVRRPKYTRQQVWRVGWRDPSLSTEEL